MLEEQDHRSTSIVYKPSVLVAGGAGFIGSFLCQSLLFQGCRVLALDNLITGKEENLKDCFENSDFSFIKRNLSRSLRKIDRVDYVFHLAGMEGDRKSETKNLLEFAKKNGSRFLLASFLDIFPDQRKGDTEKLVFDYFNQGVDVRLVRLGWVYGPRMNLASSREMAEFFKSVTLTSFINVPGTGEREIYPTFISDVIYGLTKAMFATQTSGEIFTLLGSEKINFFELAQKVKKISGKNLKMKFIAGKERRFKIDPSIGVSQRRLGWKARVSIDEGLSRTLDFFSRTVGKIERRSKDKFASRPTKRKVFFKFRLLWKPFGFFVLLVFLFLPFLLPFGFSFLGVRNLKSAYQDLKLGKVERAQERVLASWANFEKAEWELNRLDQILAVLGMEGKLEDYLRTIALAKKVARLAVSGFEAVGKMEQMSQVVFGDGGGDLSLLSSEARVLLDLIWREFSFLETELVRETKFFPEISQFKEGFSQERQELLDLSSVLSILPDLTGVKQRKTYLILFQNNMELRPTGGFIGSFVLASFDKGKLIEFEVFDVYTADGQLKGHVEPPEPLKKYLGEAGWYLRDSNWNPSFPSAAVKAEWFLEKTLGRSVDGVVAINLNLAQKILQAIDGVEVLGFEERVDSDNLFKKAEYYSQVDFFPGSTQKKDFLGALSRSLLERMRTASSWEYLRIARAIHSSLGEKDLMIYLNDRQLMEKITALNWEGSLRELSCSQDEVSCLADYLMLVEANLGVNKANFYVKRNLISRIEFKSAGKIENSLRISYLNASQPDSQFGGNYKNYLRFFVPLGSTLIEVKIDGRILAEEEIDVGIAVGKTYFGFLVDVPAGGKKLVEAVYQPPFEFRENEEIDYWFLWQRQSGADPSRTVLTMKFLEGTSILKTNPVPKKAGKELEFERKLNQDLLFQTRVKL